MEASLLCTSVAMPVSVAETVPTAIAAAVVAAAGAYCAFSPGKMLADVYDVPPQPAIVPANKAAAVISANVFFIFHHPFNICCIDFLSLPKIDARKMKMFPHREKIVWATFGLCPVGAVFDHPAVGAAFGRPLAVPARRLHLRRWYLT